MHTQTQQHDPNEFLMGGGGAKSFKFENPGDTAKGEIVSQQMRQQTEVGTGTPKTWDNGDPMMQLVVVLATDDRDPTDPDDDGHRAVYLKGGARNPQTTQGAVAAAVRASGAARMLDGGTLALRFTGLGTPTRAGLSAPKQYAAQYTPPTPGADITAF